MGEGVLRAWRRVETEEGSGTPEEIDAEIGSGQTVRGCGGQPYIQAGGQDVLVLRARHGDALPIGAQEGGSLRTRTRNDIGAWLTFTVDAHTISEHDLPSGWMLIQTRGLGSSACFQYEYPPCQKGNVHGRAGALPGLSVGRVETLQTLIPC